MLLATFTALALAASQGADTTIAVERGDRLEVETHRGSITVRAWNRNSVQVRGSGGRFTVDYDRGRVDVEADWEHGDQGNLRFEVSAPAWMVLELSGVNTDITVVGIEAAISAENVSGTISVEGGDGIVELETVEGRVDVSGARGQIYITSVNEAVTVRNVSGTVHAETVNGAITLTGIESSDVEAETVNGAITFAGPIRDSGRYGFATHNGGVTVTVQEGANVAVSVSTFQSEFGADFPISFRGSREGDFSFTIGSGSARLDIESFQGPIRLVRPGAVRSR
ncbi:MAG TPA: DUF4097 family beta strand repeat-containing protein [Gemmatimonadales bacterium]|nr:DUF4097 family beta strand repeat-containing protein [Gemmatimonadales bacterium]